SILAAAGWIVKRYFIFLIPPCGLHKLTGIPCPTCGFTRMVFALLELDFKEALAVQTFMFLALMFFIIWIIAGMIALVFGKFLYIEIPKFWKRNLWIPILALFLLNWIYLIYYGV
ncbi:MAG: DUF2752 domain-containing protein, partial [Thermoanaerobaculaceae bacterium]|nr:DUF2752 domain-containing protein [Thermoanaerobaculaceae bacterium]